MVTARPLKLNGPVDAGQGPVFQMGTARKYDGNKGQGERMSGYDHERTAGRCAICETGYGQYITKSCTMKKCN